MAGPAPPFRDRTAAGEALADLLCGAAAREPLLARRLREAVVLALPRGGVPVALPLARRLGAPLDLMLVRRVGTPEQPEIAAAAVAEGDPPEIVHNEDVIADFRVPDAALARGIAEAVADLARRRRDLLGARPRQDLRGRSVILVDDGIATGATMRAALRAVRHAGAGATLVAVPVAARAALAGLAPLADDIRCLSVPDPFRAVGAAYLDFSETDDATVIRALAGAALQG